MMMIVALLGLAAVLLVIEGVRKSKQRQLTANPSGLPFPPGPKPLPFLGTLFGVNRGSPYLTYTDWSKIYGDINYMSVLSQEFVILNSEEVAIELLEKRSQKYSDRPVFGAGDLFDWHWPSTNARYGPRFRLHRRLLHQYFNGQAAMAYRPRQLQKAYELLSHLLENPEQHTTHFTTFSAAVVMQVTYGYDMKEGKSFVTSMQRAADIVLHVSTAEVHAVCIAFPFVKALPTWFPGMWFKMHAAECRRLVVEAVNEPYAWVKRRVEQGIAVSSMVADAITRHGLDNESKDPELVQAIKDSAGTLYAASVETTNAILAVFVYLMMNHPEIQRRAQAEIDGVMGQQRLPEYEDRPSLPYVDAVMRETMRWNPVLSMALPHATMEDDVYRGYYIPKGAAIIPNVWAMAHDEKKYPNPYAFMPERFLREDGTLNDIDVSFVFGFGRRICPGRHVAEVSVWCAIVCILALFKIEKTEGSDDVKWTTGMASHPLPFPCKFVPRDEEMDAEKLASLINASCAVS